MLKRCGRIDPKRVEDCIAEGGYQAIVKAVEKAKGQQTVAAIERSFTAATAVDDITSINAKDLVVTKENDQVKIAFAYDKEITLLGPVSLLIHYSGSTKGS